MKWLIRIGAAILGLLVIGVIGAYFSLNLIARQAIEQSATRATGVTTTVDEVRVGLFGGTFQMNGFTLANPADPPFDSDRFLYLESVDASVSLGTLRQETVEIPHVHLEGLEMTLERKNGNQNYRVIQSNLEALARGEEEPPEDARKYVIRELLVTDIEVTFTGYSTLNRTLHLADIHMTNVGEQGEPVTRSEITGMVVREIYRQIVQHPELIPAMVVQGLNDSLRGLRGFAGSGVQFIGDITDGAGEVLGEVGQTAGEAAEGVSDFFRDVLGNDD